MKLTLRATMSLLSGLVFSLSAIGLSGCGFIDRQVMLRNSEIFSAPAVTKAHAVCFKGFSDARSDSAVGYLQNLAGMKVSNVVAMNSVPNWVNTEVRNRLSLAGYPVDSSCHAPQTSISLGGKLEKVSTTALNNYVGEVILEAEFGVDGSKILKRTFTGYYDGGALGFSPTAESFGRTLQGALDNAVGKLVSTVDSINSAPRDNLLTNSVPEKSENPVEAIGSTSSATSTDSTDAFCAKQHDGITILRGNRDQDSAESATEEMTSDLKSIYADRIKSTEPKSGTICARFIIKPDGNTDSIRIVRQTLNDPVVRDSLMRAIKKLQFGTSESDSTITQAVYSISFDPVSAKHPSSGMAALWVVCMLVCLGSLGFLLGSMKGS